MSEFCNINFKLLKKNQLFELENGIPKCIATVNAQFIVLGNTNKRFMDILNRFYSSFDGEVPLKIARHFKEFKDAEAIKGSEIIYDFVDLARKRGLKIFLLGGEESSNFLSTKRIIEEFKVEAAGYSPNYEDYPFSNSFIKNCINRITEFQPDILFVAFGAPKQEFFVDDHIDEFRDIGIKYIVGCGGTFDFFSGRIKRAPKWVTKAGLEGVYRLLQEMNRKRLFRLIYSFKFFRYIFHKPEY